MKFDLLHGRSGVPTRSIRSTRIPLRLTSLALLAALSAPALAHSDVPAARSTDVQTVASANSTSVLAGFDNSAVPQNLPTMPSGYAPVTASNLQDSRIQKLLKGALALLGTPYRWGGTTTSGFDCSGLVGYVFRTALGVELPRVSRDMAASGKSIDRDQLAEGDLVFFSRGKAVDHVGIYIGNGQFVHAPRTGRDVSVSNLDGYWARHFVSARRVAGMGS